MTRWTSIKSRVLWAYRARGPCADSAVEAMLAGKVKPSTVRGTRKMLERVGVVRCVGRTTDGRRKWKAV